MFQFCIKIVIILIYSVITETIIWKLYFHYYFILLFLKIYQIIMVSIKARSISCGNKNLNIIDKFKLVKDDLKFLTNSE
jgi:hypothetical protein